ncbi:MAG TPA: hypothetical protein VNW73_01510 [Ktedonobacteraceae bacterium]|nr:hypothetical protein [Ktedonobacteraceae bacterium]
MSEDIPIESSEDTSTSEVVPVKTPEDTSASEVAPAKTLEDTSTSEVTPAKPPAKPAKTGNRWLDITKRILVGIVMVLTIVGLLLNISALVGVWAAYGPARNSVITVSNTLTQALQVADKGMTRANGYVIQARQTVTDVNNAASLLGDNIKTNSPLITALSQRVNTKLAPLLGQAQSTANTIHDAALKVNGALVALNRFPGVTVPTLNDQITTISDRAQEAESAVQDLRVSLANIKAGLVTKAGTTVKQVTARIDAPLARIQSLINTYKAKVAQAKDRVTSTMNTILTWLLVTAISLTILSLIVTVALLLFFLFCLQFVLHGRFPSLRVVVNKGS